ncbi:MAG: RNA polymerase sigma factor [Bacteroidales bacterium]|nr:RNA polymerase sigma factor [Bacteroidales bacterium]
MTVKEYNKAVDCFSDGLWRFIRSSLKDDDRANDIVQDTYEKLWKHVTEIDFNVAKSWLFTTAYNIMIDIIRREKRVITLEAEHQEKILDETHYTGLNEILHAALERLPEQQKISVLLRDYEGYSYKEIGEITGQTEAQVKINIYRGRLAMKNYIGKIETVI